MRMVRFSNNNLFLRLAASSFIIVGIVFTVISFVLSSNYSKDLKRCSAKTDATIIDIISTKDSDGETSYETEILYTVDGKDYIVTLDQYNSTYKKGGTLEINYNPNEPTDIVQKGSKFIYIVFRIMGIGFVIIGIPLRKVMLRIS